MKVPFTKIQITMVLRSILSVATAALGACFAWGVLDVVLLVRPLDESRRPDLVAEVLLMYALVSLAMALAGALPLLVIMRRAPGGGGREPDSDLRAVLFPVMFVGWAAFFTLAFANLHLRATVLSSLSLALDAAILAAAGGIFLFWVRRPRLPDPRPRLQALGSMLGAAMAISIIACAALAKQPVVPVGDSPPARATSPALAARSPDFLIVTVDTLRSDHTSAYGYGRRTTPFLESLARDGALFHRSYSKSSWTRSTAASLLTSLQPSSHGVRGIRDAIPENARTLFEYLHARGYRTALFSANGNVSTAFGFGQGVDHFYESPPLGLLPEGSILYTILRRLKLPAQELMAMSARLVGATGPQRLDRDRWAVRRFRDWITALGGEPFVAYVHLLGVHAPYLPPPAYLHAFRKSPAHRDSEMPPDEAGDAMTQGQPVPENVRLEMIDRYDGLALFSDEQVREIVRAVRRKGRLDRTVVIVTSDHGESFWEHGTWTHGGTLHGEMVRVPLVLWAGHQIRESREDLPRGTLDTPVTTIDLMPTILALAGVACPTCEGRSLLGTLEPGRAVLIEQYPSSGGILHAVTDGQHKLIHSRFPSSGWEHWELYDLSADVAERRNLLQGPPSETLPLLRALRSRLQAASMKRLETGRIDLKEQKRLLHELKALGYVH